MRRLFAILLALSACNRVKKPEPIDPTTHVRARYTQAVERLSTEFLENGWVVSRHPDWSPEHTGDSLIWTGLWLYAAPCEEQTSDKMLRETIMRLDGALVRYEPLGEYANGRDVSLDGALGLYRGMIDRVMRCGEGDAWAPVFRKHVEYLDEHFDHLNDHAPAVLIDEFRFVVQAIGSRLGISSGPSENDVRRLETLVAGWATAVNTAHAAAYRTHLGLLALETVETAGYDVNWDLFCAATKGDGLVTVDYRCGRGDLGAWIDAFKFNRYEFQPQRAVWESENPGDVLTPGLDLLVAIREMYKI